ncbi:MAG: nuclear transport factor 2 family protein [Gemmatimonadaceae bacterium]|nr:nuclear transport factor 2 family protein [Gemmatimonadaceae bacterium]
MRATLPLSAAVLFTISCAGVPSASPSASASASANGATVGTSVARADEQAAIRAQSEAFTRAVNARDLETLAALHTTDAVIKYPDGAVTDVAGMRSEWSNAFGAPSVRFTDAITKIEVASSGDIAWDYSRWSLDTGDGSRGGGATRTWRKVGGVWKISTNVAWQDG